MSEPDDNKMQLTPELIEKFLQRRRQDGVECQKAFLRADWKILESIGHKLKGSASSFGFEDLGQLGEQLEAAAQKKAIIEIRALLERLEQWTQAHPPASY